jgi:quercetin dioxygenase-like cupin family protein
MSTFARNYREHVQFNPGRFTPVGLAETERSKVVLACFEPGQFIPVHTPKVDVMLLVLEGEGTLVAGDQKQKVGPGSVAFAAAGEARGVKADTRMVILHVVSPRPTQQDHVEVMSKLQSGNWE